LIREKTLGVKLYIGVDTFGLPHVMFVSMANVTDCEGVVTMIGYVVSHLSKGQTVLVDGSYTGEVFVNSVKGLIGVAVEVVTRSELHKFVVLPKRWVVECSFGWLGDYRLLWKNCE
jgi:transposase